jgi:enediyne biosynthesis protein E4
MTTNASRRVPAWLATCALAVAVTVTTVVAQRGTPQRGTARPAAVATPAAPFTFRNAAVPSGVAFTLDAGSRLKWFIIETTSAGVLLLDYDNDGWLDIYFVQGNSLDRFERSQPGRGNRLYRNTGRGSFVDVTQTTGVRGSGAWGMGGCVGDVDNNGFDDILVTNFGRNLLFLNEGRGRFREAARANGLDGGNAYHTGCAFGDYDADGDLDVYVASYVEFSLKEARVGPYSVVRPGVELEAAPPSAYPAAVDHFYENRGEGQFVDVSERAGIRATRPSYGFGVVWADVDNDGDSDIYVANDMLPNNLFINNGNRTFTDRAELLGAALNAEGRPQASMGVDVADYDNDGDLDIVTTNYTDDRTTLYRADNGLFTDDSQRTGLRVSRFMGWGAQFVDLDLDGLQDLVTINGHLNPRMDRPFVNVESDGRKTQFLVGYHQRSQFYRNAGDGTLKEIEFAATSPAAKALVGRGLAVGDLNNDGRMDLVIANQDEPASLLINESPLHNWLLVKLVGTRSNRSAIGARVRITTGARTQMREIKSGGSYLSQSDLRAHFGLGSADRVEVLEVRWPSGRVQSLKDVRPNQVLTVREN